MQREQLFVVTLRCADSSGRSGVDSSSIFPGGWVFAQSHAGPSQSRFGTFVAATFAADAQRVAKIARIGYLSPNLADAPCLQEAFGQGMRDLVIEYRDAAGKPERLAGLAAELNTAMHTLSNRDGFRAQ